ncbi:Excinuclease ABC, C subunit-like [Rhodopseudomonas palustris BisB18]|uniref:Excinuclease ABC, C subunit-like n=2 Tax=Rhodopseudomonas palustris TaxID=1076 RepID=Q210J0_RHOPB
MRMEDCFVYVLGCACGDRYLTYVGWTLDLDRRLAQHNAGSGARSTRGRSWVLLHAERYASRSEAMSREWHLKRDRGFRKRLAQAAAGNIQKPHSGAELTSV